MNYDTLDKTFDVVSEVVEPTHKEVGITKPDADKSEVRKTMSILEEIFIV